MSTTALHEDHEAALISVLPVLRRYAAQADESGRFASESLSALRDSGLLGCLVPTRYGGWGSSLDTFAAIAQRLAGACLSTASVWAMHCQQVEAISRHGSPRLSAQVLPEVAAGRLYLASVTTEPGKGGHLLTARSSAHGHRDGMMISRDAPVVTGGRHADGFLVTVRADEEASESEVSLVLALREQLTVEETGNWQTLGMRGTESLPLRLTGVVPRHQVVGTAGKFRDIAVDSYIPLAHIGWAACWLGAARGAFEELVRHLRKSRSSGRGPDLSSDLVRERLGRIRVDLELVHAYLGKVIDEVNQLRVNEVMLDGAAQQIHLNSLKLCASDLCYRAVDRMIETAGLSLGYSTTSPVPLERCLRDLRSASLNYSNDRLWTAVGALTLMDPGVHLV